MSTSTKGQRPAEESPPANAGQQPQPGGEAGGLASPPLDAPRQVIGRFLDSANGPAPAEAAGRNGLLEAGPDRPAVAVFCHDGPDSYIGGHVAGGFPALARRVRRLAPFCPPPFPIDEPGVAVHALEALALPDLI